MTSTHIIRKAYRYRLRGNSKAVAVLRRWDGCGRKGERFKCLACAHEAHADVNAAQNILASGLAVMSGTAVHAVVEDTVQSAGPVKRLPSEECADAD